jgi:hypothetical protein
MTTAASSQAVLDWIAGKRGEMLAVLEEAVNLDSGSADKPGADRMASLFEALMRDAGIPTRRHAVEKYGDCVSSEVSHGTGGVPHVLFSSSPVSARNSMICAAKLVPSVGVAPKPELQLPDPPFQSAVVAAV